jgi:pilus assembly protein FimV
MFHRRLFRLSSAVALSGLFTCAQAVELGDTLVRSHIGQPLSADIELTSIANEAASIQAGLASPDVYRGASIAMHPALSSLNITIVRRDGRRFLHIASPKAVESELINIFFELTENGRRSVRQTTLWFTPDPNPAPPPAPVAAPLPVPVALPAAPAQPPVKAPTPVPVMAESPRPPVLRPAPVACVQQFTAAQIGTCAAIDAKNAALRAQIVDLEEKVRVLTLAMHTAPAPAAAAVPAVKPPPVKQPPVKAPPVKLKPMGAPPDKPAGKTPWLFIGIAGAAVCALIGVLVFFLLRKRKAGKGRRSPRTGPGLIASVKSRLVPARKAPAASSAEVEPAAG